MRTRACLILCFLASTSVAAGALVVGCSGDDTGGGPSADAGPDTNSPLRDSAPDTNPLPGDGSPDTNPPASDSSTDTGSDGSETGAPSTKNGTITVDLTSGAVRFSDVADTTLPYDAPGAGCTVTTAGACKVTKCLSAGDASAPAIQPSSGVVTITGGTGFPDGGLVVTPDPQNGGYAYYPKPSGTPQFIKTGDTLTVTSAGDAIPAIAAQTVTVPADLQLEMPSFTPASDGGFLGSFPDIALGSDLTLTWKDTTSTAVIVILTTPHPGYSFENLVCTFPGSAGTATIPTATLSNLGPTGSPAGFLSIAAANQSSFKAGDYAMTFSAHEQIAGWVNAK